MTAIPLNPTVTRVIVVPGFGATPQDHWFPWLTRAIPGVEVLSMPTPHAPEAARWVPVIARAIDHLSADTALITHSLGGIAAVRAVESLARHHSGHLAAFIAVAPFAQELPPTGEGELDSFVATGLPAFLTGARLSSLPDRLASVTVIRSDNDPLVPPAISDKFAEQTGARSVVIAGAGHFLASEGITELPQVVQALNRGASG